jgi:hypothetical protein
MHQRVTAIAAAATALLSVSLFSSPAANAMTHSWPSTARVAADDLSATNSVAWCRCRPGRPGVAVYGPSRSRVVIREGRPGGVAIREGRRARVGATVREGSRTSIRTGGSVRTQSTTVRSKATVGTTGTRAAPSGSKAAPSRSGETPAR